MHCVIKVLNEKISIKDRRYNFLKQSVHDLLVNEYRAISTIEFEVLMEKCFGRYKENCKKHFIEQVCKKLDVMPATFKTLEKGEATFSLDRNDFNHHRSGKLLEVIAEGVKGFKTNGYLTEGLDAYNWGKQVSILVNISTVIYPKSLGAPKEEIGSLKKWAKLNLKGGIRDEVIQRLKGIETDFSKESFELGNIEYGVEVCATPDETLHKNQSRPMPNSSDVIVGNLRDKFARFLAAKSWSTIEPKIRLEAH